MHILEQNGLCVLEKSRAYYYRVREHSEEDWELLDNEGFTILLQEIEAFSEQFHAGQITGPHP